MTSSITKISTVTLSSTEATISFTNIPQIYTDLLIKLSSRTNRSSGVDDDVFITFNGASTTYAYRYLRGNGTTTASGNGANRYAAIANSNGSASANTFANADIYIPNYSATVNAKTLSSISVSGSNTTENYLVLMGNKWTTTSAITSIGLTSGTSNSFVAHTTATLYGIKNYVETSTGSKATGGTITTSGGYTYHTFFSSGMFTPTATISAAEVLVVAGGGAGGWDQGGGGGAGGYRTTTLSLTSGTAYQAIVGAGGSGNLAPSEKCNGNNSVFSSFLASGGGGAGGYNQNGNAGGSGGGGGGANTGTGGTGGAGNVGSFSPVEGYAGGTSPNSQYSASGGGGATEVGQNAPGSLAGKGGNGSSAHSVWLSATNTGNNGYLAAGGGGGIYSPGGATGGAGGFGGAGFGGGTIGSVNGTPALPNTGSGGGGGSGNGGLGGAGGSGIIIVRYTT
jgi:hypothetical protein